MDLLGSRGVALKYAAPSGVWVVISPGLELYLDILGYGGRSA